MLSLLSPAKTLDLDAKGGGRKSTQPVLLDQAELLVKILRGFSAKELAKLMGISAKLAEENVARFSRWSRPFNNKNAQQALVTFQGDVYQGMDVASFKPDDFQFAQSHLRILSGLYGVLRPLDLMQAYRLEMGTRLKNPHGRNLYDFWGTQIAEAIQKQLKTTASPTLLNLASKEYFQALPTDAIDADVITPVFKDWKNGQYKIISFFAKKARGMMAGYVIRKRITDVAKIKRFQMAGYRYMAEESSDHEWVFYRRD